MPDSALPPNLKGKRHTDWIWPFSLIPRGWTAFTLKTNPPKLLLGYNVSYWSVWNGREFPHPIQPRLNGKFCSFQLCWPLFVSITFKWGFYFYVGARYDGVDHYYQIPAIDVSRPSGFER